VLRQLSPFALALLAIASRLESQEGRLITGRVLAAADSTPLGSVRTGAVGTLAVTFTNSAGRFALRTPAGVARITIRGLGIAPDTVTVPAGQDTVSIFARALAVRLAPVTIEREVSPARARFDTSAQTSIITLSPHDITQAPGLLEPDVVRAVQLLPGTVARNDYSLGYNVRGGESDQNLVRLDGVTVFNPSHVGGLFSTFDVNAVDGVDFLTSGFPAEYSGRLSSVLDVRLRPGNHDHVRGSGAVSLLSSKALVEGPAGPASFLFSARRTYADQVVKAFSSQTLPYYFTDLLGKVDLPYRGGGDVSVTGYWGRDALALNLVPASTGQKAIDLAFNWGNGLLGLNWRQPVGRGTLEQHLSVSQFSTALGLKPNLATYSNQARLWSAGSALTLAPGTHHHLKLGIDLERYDLRYTITNPAIPAAFRLGGGLSRAFFDTRYRPDVLAVFADDQWRPTTALLVRAGLRAEHVTGAASSSVAPRAALKLFLSADQAITGSVGRYYQVVQSLRDQDLPISIFEFWVGANGSIPVARSDHLVLGYERWIGGATQFTVEAYRKTFGNLITPNPGLALRDSGRVFLPVDGNAWGVDVLLRRHTGAIRGWIAYSFVRAVRRSGGQQYPPVQDRQHTLNVVVQAPGPLHSELGIRWTLGSPLPYTALIGSWDHGIYSPTYGAFTDANNEPIGGALNGARYPIYSRLDAGFRWHGRKWGMRWEPYLDVVNVYNRRNVFAYFFNTDKKPPTRTAFYQLPILATFGVDFSW
jgi:TonB-dependent receptor-like protein